MTQTSYAVVSSTGYVENVIIIDDTDTDSIDVLTAMYQEQQKKLVAVTSPNAGYAHVGGSWESDRVPMFRPPQPPGTQWDDAAGIWVTVNLTVDPPTATLGQQLTVTYIDQRSSAPANVDVTFNGTTTNVALVDHQAQLQITAPTSVGTATVTANVITVDVPVELPLPSLTASTLTIPADGTTASTVTYANQNDGAPTSATFNVNGALTTEPVMNGQAAIDVTSTTSGDTITVTCEGMSVQIVVS
jgi:hypothetical protein